MILLAYWQPALFVVLVASAIAFCAYLQLRAWESRHNGGAWWKPLSMDDIALLDLRARDKARRERLRRRA